MPDWEKIVREKLGSLPLNGGRHEEVIDELAQQLEFAYEEAIANGVSESEAMRQSLAQFTDWEKLRGEVFRSVEGTQLPIWEQNGVFAPLEFKGVFGEGPSQHRTVWRQREICAHPRLRRSPQS